MGYLFIFYLLKQSYFIKTSKPNKNEEEKPKNKNIWNLRYEMEIPRPLSQKILATLFTDQGKRVEKNKNNSTRVHCQDYMMNQQ